MEDLTFDFEQQLRRAARPLLVRGRPGDWEHTLRTIEHARYLLRHEGGDPGFVIPALYLHDIGWSLIDFTDFFTTPFQDQEASSPAILHQEAGAAEAARIMADLRFPESTTARILQYIQVHDQPQTVFDLGWHDALICFEADRLDRYGKEGSARLDGIFDDFEAAERRRFLAEGVEKWFRTRTGRARARALVGSP